MELGIRTPEADVRRRKRKHLRTLKAKVRRRRYRRFMGRYGRYVKLAAALIAGLMIIAVAAAVSGASRKQEAEAVRQQSQDRKELEAQRTVEQIAGVLEAQEVQQGEQYPFNTSCPLAIPADEEDCEKYGCEYEESEFVLVDEKEVETLAERSND